MNAKVRPRDEDRGATSFRILVGGLEGSGDGLAAVSGHATPLSCGQLARSILSNAHREALRHKSRERRVRGAPRLRQGRGPGGRHDPAKKSGSRPDKGEPTWLPPYLHAAFSWT